MLLLPNSFSEFWETRCLSNEHALNLSKNADYQSSEEGVVEICSQGPGPDMIQYF